MNRQRSCKMFFFILIPDLHVVTHSHWEGSGRDTQCKLRILSSQEAGRKLLDQLPGEEAAELAKNMPSLKETGSEPLVEVEGMSAVSLTNFIGNYYRNVAGYRYLPRTEELLGFWEPPDDGAPGEGIIMWSDLDVNYHVVIAYSREQAERLVGGFSWLAKVRMMTLLGRIGRWNAEQCSAKNEQRIDGVAAKLLC